MTASLSLETFGNVNIFDVFRVLQLVHDVYSDKNKTSENFVLSTFPLCWAGFFRIASVDLTGFHGCFPYNHPKTLKVDLNASCRGNRRGEIRKIAHKIFLATYVDGEVRLRNFPWYTLPALEDVFHHWLFAYNWHKLRSVAMFVCRSELQTC